MIAKEGIPIIVPVWILVGILYAAAVYTHSRICWVAAVSLTILGLFILYFFRDPKREITKSETAIVSPADGKIIEICEIEETEYIKAKALRVSIFLSVFNVHVNRIPLAGTIRYRKHTPGKFLAAFNHRASSENQKTSIGIECQNGVQMLVSQITGLIARRIVCYADSGDVYATGDKYGIIRFGSRTDLFLPLGTPLSVKVGDKVQGGSSLIGEMKKYTGTQ